MPYSVTLVQGVQISARRGIAFLEDADDSDVDAKEVFDGLKTNKKRDVLSRFDHWLGGNTCDKYFHGWPNDRDRKGCFVFKWNVGHTRHRLYGFLLNPRPSSDPGFQVCILVSHAQKNTEDTDPSELAPVIRFRNTPVVIAAIKRAYPELTKKIGR